MGILYGIDDLTTSRAVAGKPRDGVHRVYIVGEGMLAVFLVSRTRCRQEVLHVTQIIP